MNNHPLKARSTWLGRVIILGSAALLSVSLLALGCYLFQVRRAIEARPISPEMGQRPGGGDFGPAMELVEKPYRLDGVTLHSFLYYPAARTAVATLKLPAGLPSFFLVMEDGTECDGWYTPGEIRHGVCKVFFDELDNEAFSSLRCERADRELSFPLGPVNQ